MKIEIDNVSLNPSQGEDDIGDILIREYGIGREYQFSIVRKSLDARKKKGIVYRYRLLMDLPEEMATRLLVLPEVSVHTEKKYPPSPKNGAGKKVLIIGSGPAGLFCALRLIESGARVEIFERGKPVERRMTDIDMLEKNGLLNTESNVVFGEGGAGTYSDGKLTARTRRPESDWLYKKLVRFGAPSSILCDARPHIGTDRLRGIIVNIRNEILESGSTIHYDEPLQDILIRNGSIQGITTGKGAEYRSGVLVLATGHSARDVYDLLLKKGVALESKGFAVGIRIEHPAELINDIQYGDSQYRDLLPAAEYILTSNNKKTGRGTYSFCMCPGGRVINASSESGGLCTNGMSFSGRDLPFSNAAIVVTVKGGDIAGGLLSGIEFQRRIEEAAFESGGGGYYAPAQRVSSFMKGKQDDELPEVSYRPGARPAGVSSYLPSWIVDELRYGLESFDKQMKGFISDRGVLLGPETRTSSPARILRDKGLQSISVKGLFPAGEGSGYSGGIVSSAVDGIRTADALGWFF